MSHAGPSFASLTRSFQSRFLEQARAAGKQLEVAILRPQDVSFWLDQQERPGIGICLYAFHRGVPGVSPGASGALGIAAARWDASYCLLVRAESAPQEQELLGFALTCLEFGKNGASTHPAGDLPIPSWDDIPVHEQGRITHALVGQPRLALFFRGTVEFAPPA